MKNRQLINYLRNDKQAQQDPGSEVLRSKLIKENVREIAATLKASPWVSSPEDAKPAQNASEGDAGHKPALTLRETVQALNEGEFSRSPIAQTRRSELVRADVIETLAKKNEQGRVLS